MSFAQNVTTWHNDNNRTGWQSHETTLTTSNVNQTGSFGLLQKWPVNGYVYAQPLAVAGVPNQLNNCGPSCDLVFVATEQDMLYAFNASTNSATPVWSLDLANYIVIQGVHGRYLNCSETSEEPCDSGTLGPNEGVTGTPVIDMVTNPYTLYVVAAVQFQNRQCQNSDSICFYLYAINIRTGNVIDHQLISGIVNGHSPIGGSGKCTSDYPAQGQITFEYHHIQRPALLLLPNGTVYVAFASGLFVPGNVGEGNNGWMFAYALNNGTTLGQTTNPFNSTPYGTGGGIWQAGGGPAYDGAYIYVDTANGTLFDPVLHYIPYDIGESLLQIDPTILAVTDFYTPSNAFSYVGDKGTGLCINDEDFGSGGVLVPSDFTYIGSNGCNGGCSIAITADKQSQLYVANRGNLGKYNPSGGNNVQTLLTPHNAQNQKLAPTQGYWASPAYWHYNDGQDHYMLYYSPTVEPKDDSDKAPYPINAYQLTTSGTSGPIPDPPTASTGTKFCPRSPTPSGSWNGSDPNSGIVWAIEHQNSHNPVDNRCNKDGELPGAALHAFKATDLTAPDLYNGDHNHLQTPIGDPTKFSTPTVFKGQVYVGTQTEVDVYGLCASQQNGCKR